MYEMDEKPTEPTGSDPGADDKRDLGDTTQHSEEVVLEMNMNKATRTDDPLVRCAPLLDKLRAVSPLQSLIYLRLTSQHFYSRHHRVIRWTLIGLLVLAYFVYFGAALSYEFGSEPSVRLLVVTTMCVLGIAYYYLKKMYGHVVYVKCIEPLVAEYRRYQAFNNMLLSVSVGTAVVLFVIIETSLRRPASLVSGVGIVVFILVMFFFSKDPRQVSWRPVLWGMLLQLIFGLVVLRTTWGYDTFDWLGDRVTEYLRYTNAGSKFIFGKTFMDHFFAFQVMPVLVFFSASIGILYYLGVIQCLIEKIAFIMQLSLGTGAMESLHAAINIFVGWAEAIPMVRPLLETMSLSELHTVLTNGFATAAGSTLAIYILYGASPNHLLAASVMSAPAALAMSKLFYPETKQNLRRRQRHEEHQLPKLGSGIIDSASIGAIGAISIVSHILASVVAFISLLEFVNATLQWFGDRVGLSPPDYPTLTFQLICSYLFWPLVFLMGVEPADCRVVARLVGVKTFINEFIAYEDLGRVKRNRLQLYALEQAGKTNWTVDASGDYVIHGSNVTLTGGVISPRSEMIVTYALCGFSNVVGLGIVIGAYTAVIPSRKPDILHLSIRALISGAVACFLTASVAGLLGDQ